MITWSHTRLADWIQCPYKFHEKHIAKTAKVRETEAMRKGNKLHRELELASRAKEQVALSSDLAAVAAAVEKLRKLGGYAELAIGVKRDWSPCEFFDKEVWGRCKVDRLILNSDRPVALIVDWKTGKPKNKKYQGDAELKLHSLIVQAHYPHLKAISGFYVYTQDGSIWPEGKPHVFNMFNYERHQLDELMGRIEYAVANGKCGTRKNSLCPWCEVTHCKHYKPKET